jgi:hypothetical protein
MERNKENHRRNQAHTHRVNQNGNRERKGERNINEQTKRAERNKRSKTWRKRKNEKKGGLLVLEASFLGLNLQQHEAQCACPSSTKINNLWIHTFMPLVRLGGTGVK